MRSTWVPLHDIPAAGRDFSFPDHTLWSEIWEEFNLPYTVGRPLTAQLHLTVHPSPVGDGVHIRGEMEGSIIVACDRCTEEAEAHVDAVLEDFEALDMDEHEEEEAAKPSPGASRKGRKGAPPAALPVETRGKKAATPGQGAPDDEDAPLQDLLREGPQGLEFDVQGYLWQQFLLALPAKPLCDPACKGLCPKCGANKNQDACQCQDDEGDPRLAVLRQLKRS